MKLLFSLFIIATLLVAGPGRAQISSLPSYQVIYDDFNYTPATYEGNHGPNTSGTTWNTGSGTLLGTNTWIARPGVTAYQGKAWYFHNWVENCRLHDDAEIEVTNIYYGSVKFKSTQGFARHSGDCSQVPPQLETGFIRQTGTWAVRMKMQELEDIVDFTQTFWLHSGHVALLPGGDTHWSELNHEWNNWFDPQNGNGASWVWEGAYDYALSQGHLHSPTTYRNTHLANGVKMYEFESPNTNGSGTQGGIPLRNPRKPDNSNYDFTCYRSPGHPTYFDELDPRRCMEWLVKDLNGNPGMFVDLMIQYDGDDLTYTAVMPNYTDGYFVWMERTVHVGKVSQPLIARLTQHTSSSSVSLPAGQSAELEIEWFYYASDPTVGFWDMENQTEYFRNQGWERVNLDGETLTHPPTSPWVVKKLYTPGEASDTGTEWIVQPTTREHNRHTVRWEFRYKKYSSSSWKSLPPSNGGLSFELPVEPIYEAEVTVSVDDFYDSAGFTPEVCRSYNYVTGISGYCGLEKRGRDGEATTDVPTAYVLGQNYPNPFNPATEITYSLPKAGHVSLVIYDVLGREVERLVDETMEVGKHRVVWDAQDVSTGTYIYRLRAGDFMATRSMILLK